MADEDDLPDDSSDNPAIDPAPGATPRSARAWLALIARGEKAFNTWQRKADSLDKAYANLEKLAGTVRDREYQLFWANIQVLAPSIYSRPPVPVVVPAFRDQRALQRTSSEMLERGTVTAFRLEDIDSVMRAVRDDMVRIGRGAPWLRYSTEKDEQRVCIDHVERKDFVHDPARKWKEVDWVAKRSWLTRTEARKRFKSTSGDEYRNATYAQRKKDDGDTDGQLKAGFWELWSKSANKVVWVAEGCEKLLDEGDPHLDLEGFFPCPRPAYATVEPGTLVPVPDMLFYKDQLEEINEITARMAALTEALRLKGFYPAGAGEIGDAIEAAIKDRRNNAMLIGISNWAALGGGAAKDSIVWLPLDVIASTITGLIALRKQLIDDVYQITGLSDIMRGDTDPNETMGAQQLKSQYGSIRVHDRQAELVRVARDITRIAAEIMAENFSGQSLLDISQMQVPTKAEIAKKVAPLKAQLKKLTDEVQEAKTDPEILKLAQQKPDVAKQAVEKVQQQAQAITGQLQELDEAVTIEDVVKFLRDNRMRPFTLDIETDSTIAPDEAAQQARASQFVKEVGAFLGSAIPQVEAVPQIAPVVSDLLKFVVSQFRVGRQIEGTMDKFADEMVSIAGQPKGPTPAQQKAQADAQGAQAKNQLDAAQQTMQAQLDQANLTIKQQQGALQAQKQQADIQLASARLELDRASAAANAKATADKNAIDAHKHHSIEETKREGQALEALVEIEVAEINAKAANQGEALAGQLEGIADLQQQEHEQEMQGGDPSAMAGQPVPDPAAQPAPQQPSAIGQLTQLVSQISQQNQILITALTAPKHVIYGPDGRPIGVESMVGGNG